VISLYKHLKLYNPFRIDFNITLDLVIR
jgi:hypothetical protein